MLLPDDPGSVGMIPGNHVAAIPRRVVLSNTKIPAISDNAKALRGDASLLCIIIRLLRSAPPLRSRRINKTLAPADFSLVLADLCGVGAWARREEKLNRFVL